MDIDEIRRENIRTLEKEHGAPSLANGAGMSMSQFYNLRDGAKDSRTGKRRGMRKETAWKIEDAAGMPRGWLDIDHSSEQAKFSDQLKSQLDLSSNIRPVTLTAARIPLISWVTAGSLVDIEDNHLPGEADHWVTPEYTKPSKHAFALRVEGDSMSGGTNGINFPDGCLIIVDPERAPKSGDYVVAKDTITQKATFKKLTTDGASWFLKPINPAYPTKEIDDPALRVIGVVIEWQTGGKL